MRVFLVSLGYRVEAPPSKQLSHLSWHCEGHCEQLAWHSTLPPFCHRRGSFNERAPWCRSRSGRLCPGRISGNHSRHSSSINTHRGDRRFLWLQTACRRMRSATAMGLGVSQRPREVLCLLSVAYSSRLRWFGLDGRVPTFQRQTSLSSQRRR